MYIYNLLMNERVIHIFIHSFHSYVILVTGNFSSSDNAEFAAGVKQSAKISFDDDVAPARSRLKALSAVEKNNAINALALDDRPDTDSNIKIEGLLTWLCIRIVLGGQDPFLLSRRKSLEFFCRQISESIYSGTLSSEKIDRVRKY